MTTTEPTHEPTHEPTSADVEVEIANLDAEVAAHEVALAEWDEANAAGQAIDYEEKPRRRNLIEVLRDRRLGAQARRDDAARRERLSVLATLRAEIEASAADDARDIAAAAVAVHEASVNLAGLCRTRTARLEGFHRALRDNGVPDHTSQAPEPSPSHGGLGWAGSQGLAVGRVRMRPVNARQVLDQVTAAAERTAADKPDDLFARLHAKLRTLDDVVQWPTAQRFFLGGGGAVHVFGEAGPDETTAQHLTHELTEGEALTSWWRSAG